MTQTVRFHLAFFITGLIFCALAPPLISGQEKASPKNPTPEGKSPLVAGTPLDARFRAGVYSNRYFGFSLTVPQGWITIGGPGTPASQLQRAENDRRAYVLLAVGSNDKQLHGTRWIAISAASPVEPHVSADDYLGHLAKLNEIAQSAHIKGAEAYRVTGPPSQILLGGRRFARINIKAQVKLQDGTYDTFTSIFAIVARKSLLLVNVSDPVGTESQKEAAAQITKSLRFFPIGLQ